MVADPAVNGVTAGYPGCGAYAFDYGNVATPKHSILVTAPILVINRINRNKNIDIWTASFLNHCYCGGHHRHGGILQ